MRKIVIGSGLGLVAAAIPAHGAVLPIAAEPAGVSEAGTVRLADQAAESQGVLIGLNKPGETQIKSESTATDKWQPYQKFKSAGDPQVKASPYDKMNSNAQLKLKGESQIKLNGDGLKTGTQIKAGTNAGLLCNGFGDGSVKPGQ